MLTVTLSEPIASAVDQYAVIGNPIHHSRSPQIHRLFAAQTQQAITYTPLLAPLDGFVATVQSFIAQGGQGMNVTVPFKLEAYQLATQRTQRAELAGAVNTLCVQPDGTLLGDNTDGAGLVNDLQHNLQIQLAGKRIALLGAGGAARGVILPLLQAQVAAITIVNRTLSTAQMLCRQFAPHLGSSQQAITAMNWQGLHDGLADAVIVPFDVVINATSTSLQGEALPLPTGLFAPDGWAYDMMYGAQPTIFMQQTQQLGADHIADGLGMLVEQAAEAFAVWRGVRPRREHIAEVLQTLRQSLADG
jgi:shikimate dehydrogenase